MPAQNERRFSASPAEYETTARELDAARMRSKQTLRRALGQWDGLASLKDEIRRVEIRIKHTEAAQCMLMLAEGLDATCLQMQEAELSSLKAYLKGLRYNLDCRLSEERAA